MSKPEKEISRIALGVGLALGGVALAAGTLYTEVMTALVARRRTVTTDTLMEKIAKKWAQYGYQMPHLIFWNVQARQNNIPMLGQGPISYVSGFSPAIFETLMSGKTGYDLMMEKLDSERYAAVQ